MNLRFDLNLAIVAYVSIGDDTTEKIKITDDANFFVLYDTNQIPVSDITKHNVYKISKYSLNDCEWFATDEEDLKELVAEYLKDNFTEYSQITSEDVEYVEFFDKDRDEEEKNPIDAEEIVNFFYEMESLDELSQYIILVRLQEEFGYCGTIDYKNATPYIREFEDSFFHQLDSNEYLSKYLVEHGFLDAKTVLDFGGYEAYESELEHDYVIIEDEDYKWVFYA